jgi:XTP/dITP diphosphohydrolase
MKLLVASTNPGKLREIRAILAGAPVELVTLDDFPALEEPEETGATFAENACLKALYYHRAIGLPTVAEDSGLEIEALGGIPGVQSARWEGSDYAVKFRRIYELLRARGAETSAARFVCALALAADDEIQYEVEGTVEGEIAPEPRGNNGFGYDPIFLYRPLGRTLGELERDLKTTLSHRGAAFRALKRHLQTLPTFL